MKRIFITLIIILVLKSLVKAQTGQFAVVRPDGTTYICPTWDSAYNKSIDGDNIYMPGINLSQTITINKKLFIYGAGHHPDSSAVTGKTTINGGNFNIGSGSSGGSIEGINLVSASFYFSYSGRKINGYTIKNCRALEVYFSDGSSTPVDSFPTNVVVTECVLEVIDCSYGHAINNYFSKNFIRAFLIDASFCSIKNNIFFNTGNTALNGYIFNCTVENNIFLSPSSIVNSGQGCNSNYYNNLKIVGSNSFLLGCAANAGLETGTITIPTVNDIFVAFDPSFANYPYIDDYHLKPTCPGVNAGTDGTDLGVYGTSSPTNAGWVPSNPHIYFKQVAPETNNSGQLNIQFKVRTNN